MPKIGDTVWIYDVNRREYTTPTPEEKARGVLYGQLIWRGCWRAHKIVGETRVSWLLEWREKIPKKPPYLTQESPCYSEQELDDRCFAHSFGYKIGEFVGRLGDAGKLRAIAEIAGYKLPT